MAIEPDRKDNAAQSPSDPAEASGPRPLETAAADGSELRTHEADVSGVAPTRAGAGMARTPGWVVPFYLAGLACLYLAERVVVESDAARFGLGGLGFCFLIAATGARFNPHWRAGGDRRTIETLLSVVSLTGLLGVGLYFASTDVGLDKLGLEGSARGTVGTLLNVGWVILVTLSIVPMLFAEAALYPMRDAERLESRRVQAAAASGFALALAAVYGSLFVYAASDAEVQADYSYFKTSEPGGSTRRLIEHLTEPLQIYAFFPDVSEVRPEVAAYLTQLTRGVENVELKVIDRYLEPTLAKELKVSQDGSIIFQRGDTREVLNIGSELADARKKLRTLDKQVNESLVKLLQVRRSAYLTVGHGEIFEKAGGDAEGIRSGNILRELIQKLNYRVKNLGIADGLGTEVPDDATVVVVAGPTQAFATEEIESLDRYVQRGGKVLMALDVDTFSATLTAEGNSPPDAPSEESPEGATAEPAAQAPAGDKPDTAAPSDTRDTALVESLKQLARVVGVEFQPTVLANAKTHVRRRNNDSDRILIPSNRFSSHASVSTVGRRRNGILLAGASSLTMSETRGSKQVDLSLRALPGTFADKNGNFRLDEGEQEPNFNLVAAIKDEKLRAPEPEAKEGEAAERPDKRTDPTPPEMRAMVIADADALTDVIMSRFVENQLFIYDALRWLGGEESLAGTITTEEDVRIEHTKQKDQAWFYSTIFGIPLFVLVGGLAHSRRSRKKKGAR